MELTSSEDIITAISSTSPFPVASLPRIIRRSSFGPAFSSTKKDCHKHAAWTLSFRVNDKSRKRRAILSPIRIAIDSDCSGTINAIVQLSVALLECRKLEIRQC